MGGQNPQPQKPSANLATSGSARYNQIRDEWMSGSYGQTPQELANFIRTRHADSGVTVGGSKGDRLFFPGGGQVDAVLAASTGGKGNTWTNPFAPPPQPQGPASTGPVMVNQRTADPQSELMRLLMERMADDRRRGDELYGMYTDRAKQGLAIDRNDPIIRAQADAYGAQQERARRNYLADLAEQSGPLTNLRGEQRLSAERLGQAVGGFEAELLGRELTARREEIAQALEGMRGLLTADQEINLRRELGYYDDAIAKQRLALDRELGFAGLDVQREGIQSNADLERARLNSQMDQFLAELGFRTDDRNSYWDAIRSGLITG
jgi:hypothetical protein